jgi:hypothetical protein
MIKVLNKKYKFFEAEQEIELEINGKKVIVSRYEKQDPQFSDYELEVEIKDETGLTENEIEEVETFVKEDLDD